VGEMPPIKDKGSKRKITPAASSHQTNYVAAARPKTFFPIPVLSCNTHKNSMWPPRVITNHGLSTYLWAMTSVLPERCQTANKAPQWPHLCSTSLNQVARYGIQPRQSTQQQSSAARLFTPTTTIINTLVLQPPSQYM
jgi:hypothetical protein